MCLTKLQKRTPQGYGFKVYEKLKYDDSYYRYRGIFDHEEFAIGDWTTPAKFYPFGGKSGWCKFNRKIKTKSGRYYDPGYHIYDNLVDAQSKIMEKASPRREIRIVRVEYKSEDVICTGYECTGYKFETPVTVVRKLKLVEELERIV